MSSRDFEERQDRKRVAWIAAAVGLSPDELSEVTWDFHEVDGHDGAVYGYRVEFDRDTDPVVIERVGGYSVNIGFPPEDPEPEQP